MTVGAADEAIAQPDSPQEGEAQHAAGTGSARVQHASSEESGAVPGPGMALRLTAEELSSQAVQGAETEVSATWLVGRPHLVISSGVQET